MSESGDQYTVAIMKEAMKIDATDDPKEVAKAFDNLLYEAANMARDAYGRIMRNQTGEVKVALHDEHVRSMGGM